MNLVSKQYIYAVRYDIYVPFLFPFPLIGACARSKAVLELEMLLFKQRNKYLIENWDFKRNNLKVTKLFTFEFAKSTINDAGWMNERIC